MANSEAETWLDKGKKEYYSRNFEEAAKCYAEAARLGADSASVFHNWGVALSNLAEIKKDEALFRKAFEKFGKAAQIDPDNAFAFSFWGDALAELAGIKEDEALFREAFEKYEKAAQLDPGNATVYKNCANALSGLARINKDEALFREAFEKYEKAAQLDPDNADTFIFWGETLAELARIKDDEALYREAFEKFEKAAQIDPDDADTFSFWGVALDDLARIKADEALYKESLEKYGKAAQLDPYNIYTFDFWGDALAVLARIKEDELLFREAFEKYGKSAQLNPYDAYVFNSWGHALADFAEIKEDENSLKEIFEELYEKSESLKKFKKDILGILVIFNNERIRKIIKPEMFFPLLDSDTDEGQFFEKTTEGIDKEKKDAYKEAYILSFFIISQLHVNNYNEKSVAYYCKKTIAQKLLFNKDSEFRLNAINYSNDPTEGKTLLDCFFTEGRSSKKIINTEYGAFAGCFTFSYNSLNQFRLYGKDENKEGTGVALVFGENFFSDTAKGAMQKAKIDGRYINQQENEKHALFRCIYIDPETQRVETVGRKEEYLFYRENNEGAINEYNDYIVKTIESVRVKMEDLKKAVKDNDLDPDIVGQLLINLRYLTKHIAFKEEQECRIVKICRLADKNNKIETSDDNKQLYVEYKPNVAINVEKIYFGPKAAEMELFQDILTYKGLPIPCEKSKNPLA
jgi:tetratricopeptide (TPR) repeat protein